MQWFPGLNVPQPSWVKLLSWLNANKAGLNPLRKAPLPLLAWQQQNNHLWSGADHSKHKTHTAGKGSWKILRNVLKKPTEFKTKWNKNHKMLSIMCSRTKTMTFKYPRKTLPPAKASETQTKESSLTKYYFSSPVLPGTTVPSIKQMKISKFLYPRQIIRCKIQFRKWVKQNNLSGTLFYKLIAVGILAHWIWLLAYFQMSPRL